MAVSTAKLSAATDKSPLGQQVMRALQDNKAQHTWGEGAGKGVLASLAWANRLESASDRNCLNQTALDQDYNPSASMRIMQQDHSLVKTTRCAAACRPSGILASLSASHLSRATVLPAMSRTPASSASLSLCRAATPLCTSSPRLQVNCTLCNNRKEKKRLRLSANLMRSQVLYRAARVRNNTEHLQSLLPWLWCADTTTDFAGS